MWDPDLKSLGKQRGGLTNTSIVLSTSHLQTFSQCADRVSRHKYTTHSCSHWLISIVLTHEGSICAYPSVPWLVILLFKCFQPWERRVLVSILSPYVGPVFTNRHLWRHWRAYLCLPSLFIHWLNAQIGHSPYYQWVLSLVWHGLACPWLTRKLFLSRWGTLDCSSCSFFSSMLLLEWSFSESLVSFPILNVRRWVTEFRMSESFP